MNGPRAPPSARVADFYSDRRRFCLIQMDGNRVHPPENEGISLFAKQTPEFEVKESMCSKWVLPAVPDFMQPFAALERPANGGSFVL